MNRDFTMLGAGLISGHLLFSLATQTTSIGSLVVAVIGLVLVVGSRKGLFGMKKVPA